jgi:hypothetical protein
MVILISFLLLISIFVPTSLATDAALDNTMGGRQGLNAYASSGDPFFLAADNFLDGGNGYMVVVRNHENSYNDGPWKIAFADTGLAHYHSWPDAIISGDVIAWHSRIFPADGGYADVWILQYPYDVSGDLAVAAIKDEIAGERGVQDPVVTPYADGSATGQGTNALGTQEYAKFTPLPNSGPNYALLLLTDSLSIFDGPGNSISVI